MSAHGIALRAKECHVPSTGRVLFRSGTTFNQTQGIAMRIIAGAFGGRTIKTVEGPGYRPATAKVRGAVFSMLEARGVTWGAVRVLDLFAGSGSLGFEALSRGALEACFVEKAARPAACLRTNAASFSLDESRCRVVEQDVAAFLRPRALTPYDIIFIDPPYGEGRLVPSIKAVTRGGWLAPQGFLLAEVETHLRLDPTKDAPELTLETDRTYGQTRILLWQLP